MIARDVTDEVTIEDRVLRLERLEQGDGIRQVAGRARAGAGGSGESA